MRTLAFLVAALALVAAGCGGGGESKPLTKAEYQAQLEQTAKEIAANIGTSNDLDKASDADMKKLTDALHEFAKKLDDITPPAEVAALHARLITTMNDLADEFPGIVQKMKDVKDAGEAIGILFGAHAIQELIKLGSDFKKKGYDLNLNADG